MNNKSLTPEERIQRNCEKFNTNFLTLISKLSNLSTNDFTTTTNIRTFLQLYKDSIGGVSQDGEPSNPEKLENLCKDIFSQIILHSSQIKSRNMEYFMDPKNPLYTNLTREQISSTSKFINSLSQSTIDSIWEYFDLFLAIANRVSELEVEKIGKK